MADIRKSSGTSRQSSVARKSSVSARESKVEQRKSSSVQPSRKSGTARSSRSDERPSRTSKSKGMAYRDDAPPSKNKLYLMIGLPVATVVLILMLVVKLLIGGGTKIDPAKEPAVITQDNWRLSEDWNKKGTSAQEWFREGERLKKEATRLKEQGGSHNEIINLLDEAVSKYESARDIFDAILMEYGDRDDASVREWSSLYDKSAKGASWAKKAREVWRE